MTEVQKAIERVLELDAHEYASAIDTKALATYAPRLARALQIAIEAINQAAIKRGAITDSTVFEGSYKIIKPLADALSEIAKVFE